MKRKRFLRVVPSQALALVFLGALFVAAPLRCHAADAPPLPTAAPSLSSPSKKNLSSELSRLAELPVKDGRVAGISYVVLKNGAVLASGADGFADLENRVPARVDTVYAIGSITKTFTAAAVLTLAAEGKLSLDDTVGAFAPAFPEPGRSATIRQLLGHTSGIRSMTSLGPKYWLQAGREIEPKDLVVIFADAPSDFPPGTKYRYSNSGYVLLGLAVEKAAGMPWGDYVTKTLLVPLGLTATRDGQTAALVPNRARGTSQKKGGGFENAWHVSLTQGYAAGALLSTAGDVAAWMRKLALPPPAGIPVAAEMATPGTLPDGTKTAYGKGLGIETFAGRRFLFHGGGLPGFDAVALAIPDEDLEIAVLCNTNGEAAMDVAHAMTRLLLGVPDEGSKKPGP